MPVDEVKYWLFLHFYKKLLESKGVGVKLVYIIADKGVFNNFGKSEKVIQWRKKRIKEIKALNKFFNNEFKIVLQSEILVSNEEINEIWPIVKSNISLLERTIPPSRLLQERKRKYRYSLEELLAFIKLSRGMPLIKVGPPREKYYDALISLLKKNSYYIYLKPVYPVNCTWAFYLYREDIREFGVTPYKVGSAEYVSKRIIITDDISEIRKKLMNLDVPEDFPIDVLSSYKDMIRLFYAYKGIKKVPPTIRDKIANEIFFIINEIFGDEYG